MGLTIWLLGDAVVRSLDTPSTSKSIMALHLAEAFYRDDIRSRSRRGETYLMSSTAKRRELKGMIWVVYVLYVMEAVAL